MPLALLDSSIFKMSFPQVFFSTWEKMVQSKLSYEGYQTPQVRHLLIVQQQK